MASALLLSAGSDYNGPNSLFPLEERPMVSYVTKTVEVPFQANHLKFGDLAYATLPKRDDIIKSVTLKSTLGTLYPITANGYVYPNPITDTNFYNSHSQKVIDAVNIYGYYNTQLLYNWVQRYITSNIYVVNGTFQFDGFVGAKFKSEQAATFWGFDIRYATFADTYWTFTSNVPQMSLIQSGWVQGFLPPPLNFTYKDSVGYLLPRISTLYIGGQTIQTINSQTLYIETDLQLPLENQAGLTILVGKNDPYSQSQSRNYWTNLTFNQIPISQLGQQDVQISVQFENFNNLTSRTTNGGVLNGSAYTLYKINPVVESITQVLTYKGLIVTVSSLYVTIYNELTGAIIQQLPFASDTYRPSCITNDKFYYMIDNQYLASYSIGQNGLTNSQIGTVNIQTSYGVFKLLGYGNYLMIVYDDYIKVYDTLQDLSVSGAYSTLSVTSLQTFMGTSNVAPLTTMSNITGRRIFFPVIANNTNITYIVYCGIQYTNHFFGYFNKIQLSNLYYYLFPNLSLPGVSDGTYIYYPFIYDENSNSYAYRINSVDGITPSVDIVPRPEISAATLLVPLTFDGTYVYYNFNNNPDNQIYAFYNTQLKFSDPNAWGNIVIYPDGTTKSSNGTSSKAYPGNTAYNAGSTLICTGSLFSYSFNSAALGSYTTITKIDPYVIVPSISASLIVEYSKLIEPEERSQSLIKQTQMNTFTMIAGLTQEQFIFTFTGPVRELWFKTSASIARILIMLNGTILADEDYNSLNILRPFEKHAITPYQTTGVYSIALDPNNVDPTGTLNISRIRMATIQVYFSQPYSTDQNIYVFARSMNVLECDQGVGGLLFN